MGVNNLIMVQYNKMPRLFDGGKKDGIP